MKRLLVEGKIFNQFDYSLEKDLERAVVNNKDAIFGKNGIYCDVKRLIGSKSEHAGIPDGYFIDLKDRNNPVLYIVEVELDTHDIYSHISDQLFRFAINANAKPDELVDLLKSCIDPDDPVLKDFYLHSSIRNIDELLYRVVKKEQIKAIVIINKTSDELVKALGLINIPISIIEFATFRSGDNFSYVFEPLDSDVIDSITETPSDVLSNEERTEIENLDTIIVPAKEDGFTETFLGENCWYAIRISPSMLDKIKYIAAYISAPKSEITYFARVDKIVKYIDEDTGKATDKYKVIFAAPAEPIGPIMFSRSKSNGIITMQSPRYTSFSKLSTAKKLSDLF